MHLAKIRAEFGPLPIGSTRPSMVRSWLAGLRGEGNAQSYVYALHSRLSQVMADAVHDGVLARSPCSRRTSPGAGKQRTYVATTEQVWGYMTKSTSATSSRYCSVRSPVCGSLRRADCGRVT